MTHKMTIPMILVLFLALSPWRATAEEIPETLLFKGRTGPALVDHASVMSGPVTFHHSRHVDDYGAGCGDCHHDGSLDPIESYDPAESFSCGDCHAEDGFIRGPIAENDTPEDERLMHRANAIHTLCIDCHKKENNRRRRVLAPEACMVCHKRLY